MVKNPPSNAEDMDLIPGWGNKILHAAGQLSPRSTMTEPVHSGTHTPQLERSPHTATKDPVYSREDPACCNEDPTQPNK